jgi:hypothetical protein
MCTYNLQKQVVALWENFALPQATSTLQTDRSLLFVTNMLLDFVKMKNYIVSQREVANETPVSFDMVLNYTQ